jgi:hypothetical protein
MRKRTALAWLVALLLVVGLVLQSSGSSAECAWVLWGQDEEFWSYSLLNLFPGPSRKNAYIVAEYRDREQCLQSQIAFLHEQWKSWDTPEAKEDIKKFGGLRRVSNYACVPLPLKPTLIDHNGWK